MDAGIKVHGMKTSSRFDEAMQEPLGLIQFHSVPHLDPFATVAAGEVAVYSLRLQMVLQHNDNSTNVL